MNERDRQFELLVACTREHDWSLTPAGLDRLAAGHDPRTLGRAAADHGVTNLAYLTMRGLPGLDAELLSLLTTVYHLNLTHHMKVIGDVARLGEALDGHQIPFMVVKGPVLAEVVYPRNDLRAYDDVDLVVPRRRFADAISALIGAECDVLDRNWRRIRREMRGQVHMTARYGTSVDVHWHLLNRGSVRSAFRLEMDELFERARPVSLDGPRVMTLDPIDTLLHLALHAGLSGGAKLSWLKDIERAAAVEPIEWDELVRRARAWGAGEVIAVSFRRSRSLLDAPIPDGVVEALSGNRVWQTLVRGSERLSPPERPPNRPTLARAVTRATRAGLAPSVAALVSRLGADLAEQASRLAGRGGAILSTAEGDESDRLAYLDAVVRGRRAA
ncbi:MAG: hypothetical protein QOJ31_441 [Gaiellales bacterium]|nr:hypothetical protein [Gaiellales bacterium]MDX6549757.1 hypothetical protein [Gaiellales bacterium]